MCAVSICVGEGGWLGLTLSLWDGVGLIDVHVRLELPLNVNASDKLS